MNDIRKLEDAILALDYTLEPVTCTVCNRRKDPVGRYMQMGHGGCNSDCEGYAKNPYPVPLFHAERASEFGHALLPYEKCVALWAIVCDIRERREAEEEADA